MARLKFGELSVYTHKILFKSSFINKAKNITVKQHFQTNEHEQAPAHSFAHAQNNQTKKKGRQSIKITMRKHKTRRKWEKLKNTNAAFSLCSSTHLI
jgi:hypothetical protein